MKEILKRVLVTNWKTSLGGLMSLFGLVAFWCGKLDLSGLVTLLGVAGTWVGITSKDGVRTEAVVAREDVPTDTSPQP